MFVELRFFLYSLKVPLQYLPSFSSSLFVNAKRIPPHLFDQHLFELFHIQLLMVGAWLGDFSQVLLFFGLI